MKPPELTTEQKIEGYEFAIECIQRDIYNCAYVSCICVPLTQFVSITVGIRVYHHTVCDLLFPEIAPVINDLKKKRYSQYAYPRNPDGHKQRIELLTTAIETLKNGI